MAGVNDASKHGTHERICLKSLCVMSNVRRFARQGRRIADVKVSERSIKWKRSMMNMIGYGKNGLKVCKAAGRPDKQDQLRIVYVVRETGGPPVHPPPPPPPTSLLGTFHYGPKMYLRVSISLVPLTTIGRHWSYRHLHKGALLSLASC